MKNLILTITFLFIGITTFSQSLVDGKYNTTFGSISMTTEFDKEFPNGSIVYGDYKENGTITGYYADFQKEIKGTFFNGASEGKYIFLMPFTLAANQPISKMNGFWGYNSDNKNSSNSSDQWNINSKTGQSYDIKNVTNVWSGKWNTTDGAMHLVQVGKNITGRYKGVGTVTATYNPSTRLLKGTFTNNNFNKTGYIEFYFEGNTFKGKWGWTTAMTEGNWDGTKDIKNNKELSKMVVNTSDNSSTSTIKQGLTTNSNTQNTSSDDEFIKIRVRAKRAKSFNSTSVITNPDLYGFARFELKKITINQSTNVNSFGNKSKYIFEATEDNPLKLSAVLIDFPDQPTYYRDFYILKSDWDNNDVKFELTVAHHLKTKEQGQLNGSCDKYQETFNLKKPKVFDIKYKIPENNLRDCYLEFIIEKL